MGFFSDIGGAAFSNTIDSAKNAYNRLVGPGDKGNEPKDYPTPPDSKNYKGFTLTAGGKDSGSKPYGLLIINSAKNQSGESKIKAAFGFGGSSNIEKEYYFNINPQKETIKEPAAVVINPMQGGGKFIEHQGQVFKYITISGTTGYYPVNRPSQRGDAPPDKGLSKLGYTGTPIRISKLPTSGIGSGFESFIQLRTLYREYLSMKKNHPDRHKIEMVYINKKDNEVWVVEPESFDSDRDAKNPFSYYYNIAFRTIRPYEAPPQSLLEKLMAGPLGNVIETVDNAGRLISESLQGLEEDLDAISGLVEGLSSQLMSPLRQVNDSLIAVASGFNTVINIPNRVLKTFLGEWQNLENSLAAFGYDKKEIANAVNNIKKARKGTEAAIASISLQGKSFVDKANDTKEIFRASGNNAVGFDFEQTNNVSSAGVKDGDTVQDFAQRVLGDASRYDELIVLNNLKPPYIAATAGDGVIAYGDKLLIPSNKPKESGFYNPIQIVNETIETVRLNPVERKLGSDIKLNKEGDVVLSSKGDLQLIHGIENAKQALANKFRTPIGSLRPHPDYGVLQFAGRKFREDEFMLVEAELRRTTATDPRFDGLSNVQMTRERDKINISVEATVSNLDAPIQVDTSVNVGSA